MTDITQIAQIASPLARVAATPAKLTTPAQDRQEVTASTNSVFREPAAKAKEAPADTRATADEQSTAAAVVKLNDFMQQENRALLFSVDDASGRTVIKVTDTETQEVIRQIPPEQALAIMHSFAEGQGEGGGRGLLLRETV
jgi:flagellar protein FlaG